MIQKVVAVLLITIASFCLVTGVMPMAMYATVTVLGDAPDVDRAAFTSAVYLTAAVGAAFGAAKLYPDGWQRLFSAAATAMAALMGLPLLAAYRSAPGGSPEAHGALGGVIGMTVIAAGAIAAEVINRRRHTIRR